MKPQKIIGKVKIPRFHYMIENTNTISIYLVTVIMKHPVLQAVSNASGSHVRKVGGSRQPCSKVGKGGGGASCPHASPGSCVPGFDSPLATCFLGSSISVRDRNGWEVQPPYTLYSVETACGRRLSPRCNIAKFQSTNQFLSHYKI